MRPGGAVIRSGTAFFLHITFNDSIKFSDNPLLSLKVMHSLTPATDSRYKGKPHQGIKKTLAGWNMA